MCDAALQSAIVRLKQQHAEMDALVSWTYDLHQAVEVRLALLQGFGFAGFTTERQDSIRRTMYDKQEEPCNLPDICFALFSGMQRLKIRIKEYQVAVLKEDEDLASLADTVQAQYDSLTLSYLHYSAGLIPDRVMNRILLGNVLDMENPHKDAPFAVMSEQVIACKQRCIPRVHIWKIINSYVF